MDLEFPDAPETIFLKGVPQGPTRIPNYTVKDFDRECSRKEFPSRQSGRYAQYDPKSYSEQELTKNEKLKVSGRRESDQKTVTMICCSPSFVFPNMLSILIFSLRKCHFSNF
ncbi:unnamed protein product [Caenorhabditis nigoni]